MTAVDEVRERADIVDLVGDYVELKRSGHSYKGLCPFHSERTPSFVVFPDSGNWRCFGACATGGDVFDFVMRIENVDFRGALEQLARRYGVPLEPPTPQAMERKEHRDRLRDALVAASEFFHAQLMRSPGAEPAREYLRGRELGSGIAAEFGLGWAPDEWSATGDVLRRSGYSDEELLDAGLARQRDSGGVYDAFRGRLVFPIRDSRGRPIGFGARTLDPEGVPKYINSPQSELFDKSQVLYGIERAARGIRDSKRAVVVEGYTDVIRAHAAGCTDVVASLGTAVTEAQLATLKRYAERIVLALDADTAGQAATLRGLDVARDAAEGDLEPTLSPRGMIQWTRRMDVELRVATLPQGKDPDDVIREDPEEWRALVDGAQPVMEYLFQTLTADLDLDDPDGKMAAADRLIPVISNVPDAVARSAWIARLAELIRVDERALANRLMKPSSRQRSKKSQSARGRRKPRVTQSPDASQPTGTSVDNTIGDHEAVVGDRAGAEPGSSDGAPPPEAFEDAPPPGESGWRPDDEHVLDSDTSVAEPPGAEPPEYAVDHEASGAKREPGASGAKREPRASRQAHGGADDPLVSSLLGHLLLDPRRLLDLSEALADEGQPPLRADDLDGSRDRDVLEAVRHAARGAPPPDLPSEQRLDDPAPHMAPYLERLKAQAAEERAISERVRMASLRLMVLRLRERDRRRTLEGLRFLLAEAASEDRAEHYGRVAKVTSELNVLQRLLSPGAERQFGKTDAGLRR